MKFIIIYWDLQNNTGPHPLISKNKENFIETLRTFPSLTLAKASKEHLEGDGLGIHCEIIQYQTPR